MALLIVSQQSYQGKKDKTKFKISKKKKSMTKFT